MSVVMTGKELEGNEIETGNGILDFYLCEEK
jgi:hypothetical protein